MSIEKYFTEVNDAVKQCLKDGISNQEYVERLVSGDAAKIRNIINIGTDLLSPSDYQKFDCYLELGFFTEFKAIERIALFSFMFEIGRSLTVETLRERFTIYGKSQTLFSKDSSLFDCIRQKSNGDKDLELINVRSLNNIQDSEIFERGGYYYKIEPFLNQTIFTLCKQIFRDSPIYIRLDPTNVYFCCPQLQLNEEILIPANPNWWRHLKIYKGGKEGCSYLLTPKIPTKDDYQEYWDYHVRGIRRLDVVAKRNNQGNLSMMIEELSDKESDSRITIGRCIHLDSDNGIRTEFCEASLNHLDLAINIYEGDTIKERYSSNLASGKKIVDATFRTHLLRIENLPLSSLLFFAILFFESKPLLREWMDDQFIGSKNL